MEEHRPGKLWIQQFSIRPDLTVLRINCASLMLVKG
jgi:hypothetical protein